MSLATRCPACGTVFRVVSDQLKVSEGWVRCGRCAEVFNAAQRLFDLEQDAAAASLVPPAATPLPPRPLAEVHRLPLRDPGAAVARVGAALAPPSTLAQPEAQQAAPEPTPVPAPVQAPAESEEPTEQPAAVAAEAPIETTAEPVPADRIDAVPAAEPAGPTPTPEFVRRADRAARWRQPARRGPLAAVALLLVALLVGQIALHYRDHLAAAWPGTRPWLLAACNVLGCSVEAPRRIDSLHVDSSGLVRVQDSALHRLSLVLQNKAPTTVRMPAIDLVLTDAQGQTLARRVLSVAELGNAGSSLPAGGELSLQAMLDLGERRVAGYTVELFYP